MKNEETLIEPSRTGKVTLRGEEPLPSPWVGALSTFGEQPGPVGKRRAERLRGPECGWETMLTERAAQMLLCHHRHVPGFF